MNKTFADSAVGGLKVKIANSAFRSVVFDTSGSGFAIALIGVNRNSLYRTFNIPFGV
jgi:hypothetical protein